MCVGDLEACRASACRAAVAAARGPLLLGRGVGRILCTRSPFLSNSSDQAGHKPAHLLVPSPSSSHFQSKFEKKIKCGNTSFLFSLFFCYSCLHFVYVCVHGPVCAVAHVELRDESKESALWYTVGLGDRT